MLIYIKYLLPKNQQNMDIKLTIEFPKDYK